MAINPKIKQKAEDIRSKIFGSEVRESLASGIEAISEDVEATIGRQDYVEEQFQNVIDETTDKDVISAPELIAARNGKSNLKTRLDDEHAEVTAQLQQTIAKISLTPDDFTGTDIEKLQQCVDLSKDEDISINLNRMYDLTGGVINIDKGFENWIFFTAINGGGLKKHDSGYMFTSSFNDISRGNMDFNGVIFEGNIDVVTYVVNTDRIRRIFCTGSKFNNINFIQSKERFMQTLRFNGNTVENHNGYFIDMYRCFDVQIGGGNQIEAAYHGGFLKCGNKDYDSISSFVLNISNNLIEGQTSHPLFTLADSLVGLAIEDNYFEMVPEGIVEFFATKSPAKTKALKFNGNLISSANAVVFKNAHLLHYTSVVEFKHNTLSGSTGFSETNNAMTVIHENTNTFYTNGDVTGKLFTTDYQHLKINGGIVDNHGDTSYQYIEGTGVRCTISEFFQSIPIDYQGESLLINVSVSTHLTALTNKTSYVGIISFVGEYDSTSTSYKLKMYLTPLVDLHGTNGAGTNNVTATFGNGDVTMVNNDSYFTDKRLIITVGSGRNVTNANVSITPITKILKPESGGLYRSK